MSLWATTLIGILAACGTTASWIPQAWKTLRTRQADDFSWGYLALFTGGVLLWAVYGALRNDPAVLGANVVTFVFILPVIYVKLRWGRP
jgi:MtN3 and saliva related transmembrane protein